MSLILTVSGPASGISTTFQFRFFVKDPAGILHQSQVQNYTTTPGQSQFSILVGYPSVSFPGSTSLVGQYSASVDQLAPLSMPNAANTSFYVKLTDSFEYQRTQTVFIQASGYNASEFVTVDIRTQTGSVLVFSQTLQSDLTGKISAQWYVPVDAAIDSYTLTLTGASTIKNPADTQRFSVNPATMTITAVAPSKSSYQRTEIMKFSFMPKYPDGSTPSTGVGLLNLMDPSRANVTLTATYDSASGTFNATYTTSVPSPTGTWTATLFSHTYSDAFGNTGPGGPVSSAPQLTPASLSVNVATNINFVLGQQTKFNATITYPDGTKLTSGTVSSYLLYSGTPTINESIPLVFDTGLGLWIGTYTPKPSDTGGLWSLVVKASDSSTPPDSGYATRAISLQNSTTPPSSTAPFPLYYWGIIAALIAGLVLAVLLGFRRRKETHARLKIDLEAVRSEAGRIESQDFFKSIKDQLTKDEDHSPNPH